MTEMATAVNTNGLDGYRVEVFDTDKIPPEIWREMQLVHHEALKADLPRDEWDRAAALAQLGNLQEYTWSRVNPNILVDDTWNGGQLFRRPQAALALDGSGAVYGAVLTADNTSASTRIPRPLRPLDYFAKMLVPPGAALPTRLGSHFSGKRYVHLREVYAMPNAQPPLEANPGTHEVSGLIVMSLFHALKTRDDAQTLAAYILPADPADRTLVDTTGALYMYPTENQRNTLPNYLHEDRVVRVAGRVGVIGEQIKGLLAAAPEALDSSRAAFITKASIEEARQRRKEYDRYRSFEVDYEKGGK